MLLDRANTNEHFGIRDMYKGTSGVETKYEMATKREAEGRREREITIIWFHCSHESNERTQYIPDTQHTPPAEA
jgi:hypothetical protein